MSGPSAESPLEVEVETVSAEARDVMLIGLCAREGGLLPSCTPGGHIDLRLPNGLIRQYSLINDCKETDRYLIAVGRAEDSRGGSDFIHNQVREGSPLAIIGVRNNFPLDPDAGRYRFIAGGIGITPIMSMIRWCRDQNRPWKLIYAARSRQRAAFYEDLQSLKDQIDFHFDDEAGAVLEVDRALDGLAPDEQIYCCGPTPMMEAVSAATVELGTGRVHFEWFNAPVQDAGTRGDDREIEIVLQRSGKSFTVAPGESVLSAIEAAGVAHPFSCREGACRTCETTVLEGEPDHRDFVLSDEERATGNTMMVCVSRAKGDKLVLDL